MKSFFASIVAAMVLLASTTVPSFAQAGPTSSMVLYNGTADPCENPAVAKSFAVLSISTATTTQLVALTAGKKNYVCGVYASTGGTTPTYLFSSGTGTNCGTGNVALTGTFAPTSGTAFPLAGAISHFVTPAGTALCLTTGGTTPALQGVLVFVTQIK